MAFSIQSKAFPSGGDIPAKFTCQGQNVSPPFSWTDPPKDTQTLALIAHDPDAPSGDFTHWVLYDLPATAQGMPEGIERKDQLADGARQGTNGFHRIGYGGPCPPAGKAHRYIFVLYALDKKIGLAAGATRDQVENAMKGHILAQSEWMGRYQRQ